MLFGSKILVKDHLNKKVQYWLSAYVAGLACCIFLAAKPWEKLRLGSRLRRSLGVAGQESTPGTRIPPATQVRLYSGGTGSQSTQSHYFRWPILTGNTVRLIFVSTVYFGIYYCYILEKEPCNVWWLCLILIIATKNLLKPKSHSVI